MNLKPSIVWAVLAVILVGIIAVIVADEIHARQERQAERTHMENIEKCMILTGYSGDWCDRQVR